MSQVNIYNGANKASLTFTGSSDVAIDSNNLSGLTGNVQTQLGTKANTADVNTALALKANTASLGALASLSSVTTSQISDGAVTAAKLGSNAVFFTQFSARTSQHTLSGDSGWQDHITMTFTTNRACSCLFVYSSSSSYESGAVQGFARLMLDGTMIGYNSAVAKQSTANSAGAGTCIWDKQSVSAGTHTITVQLRNTVGGTTWISPYWSADGQTANTLGVLYYGG